MKTIRRPCLTALGNSMIFTVEIDLTDKGLSNWTRVASTVFQYLEMLRQYPQGGLPAYLHEERKQIAHMSFQFMQEKDCWDWMPNWPTFLVIWDWQQCAFGHLSSLASSKLPLEDIGIIGNCMPAKKSCVRAFFILQPGNIGSLELCDCRIRLIWWLTWVWHGLKVSLDEQTQDRSGQCFFHSRYCYYCWIPWIRRHKKAINHLSDVVSIQSDTKNQERMLPFYHHEPQHLLTAPWMYTDFREDLVRSPAIFGADLLTRSWRSNYYQRKFRNLTSDYTESCRWRSVNQEMWSRRCDTAEMCDMRIWRVGIA